MRGAKKALILSLLARGMTAYAAHKIAKCAESYAYRLREISSPNSGGRGQGSCGKVMAHAPCPQET